MATTVTESTHAGAVSASAGDIGLARSAGWLAVAGAGVMLVGAGLWAASGTDLDAALAAGALGDYLAAVAAAPTLVTANLSLWIVGVLLMGLAGTLMARLPCRAPAAAHAASLCYAAAVPLAIASFAAWLAIVVQLEPGTTAAELTLAEVVGWFASRADWIATVLIVGAGPALLSIGGRDVWVPRWLATWGWAAAAAGVLTVVAMFTDGLSSYGFLIVPVGLGWTLAAGVVLLRGRAAGGRA